MDGTRGGGSTAVIAVPGITCTAKSNPISNGTAVSQVHAAMAKTACSFETVLRGMTKTVATRTVLCASVRGPVRHVRLARTHLAHFPVHFAPLARFLQVAPLPVRHAHTMPVRLARTVRHARKGVLATLFVCRAPVRVCLMRPCSLVAFSGLKPLGTHVSGKPLPAISDSTTLSGRARLELTRPRGDSARAYSVLLARSNRVKALPSAPAA